MVLDALEVSAVVSVASLTIVRAGCRTFRRVVSRIAIGEAVGHDEVDDVVAGDALESALLRLSREKLERRGGVATGGLEGDRNAAGLRRLREVEPDEGVFAVGLKLRLFDFDARVRDRDRSIVQLFAVEQNHDGRDEASPPVGRFDLRDLGLSGGGDAENRRDYGSESELRGSWHDVALQGRGVPVSDGSGI